MSVPSELGCSICWTLGLAQVRFYGAVHVPDVSNFNEFVSIVWVDRTVPKSYRSSVCGMGWCAHSKHMHEHFVQLPRTAIQADLREFFSGSCLCNCQFIRRACLRTLAVIQIQTPATWRKPEVHKVRLHPGLTLLIAFPLGRKWTKRFLWTFLQQLHFFLETCPARLVMSRRNSWHSMSCAQVENFNRSRIGFFCSLRAKVVRLRSARWSQPSWFPLSWVGCAEAWSQTQLHILPACKPCSRSWKKCQLKSTVH